MMNSFEIAQVIADTNGDRYELHELQHVITTDELYEIAEMGLITGPMLETTLQCIDPEYAW